jgi:hypothetical protein
LDPFLEQLADHLTPDGNAFITQPGFLGMERTYAMARERNLRVDIALKTMLCVPAEKLERMTPAVFEKQKDVSIHFYGPFAFADTYVLRLRLDGPKLA